MAGEPATQLDVSVGDIPVTTPRRSPARPSIFLLAMGVLASLVLLVACTGGQGGAAQSPAGGGQTAAGEPTTAAGEATEGTGGGGETHTVVLEDFAFEPAELTVAAGDTVVFENRDQAPHTATHGEQGAPADDPLFDIDLPAADDSGEYTFEEAGDVPVTCKIHPDMNMTITVEE